ncbi:MAG TPA: dihydroorotate dehydrogenase [Actinomycetota bacterium]|nr:dihydroorotate dehydrogenase [Actinomycetota bacterium]
MTARSSEAAAPLATRLGPVELRDPVLVASGTYAAGREGSQFLDLSRLGGVIVKSMTLTAWRGKPTPRMCETPSGMLNAIGIQNRGVDHFIAEDLPWLTKQGATVFASIAGNTTEEFVKVADKLRTGGRGLAAVEVNISCPNLEDRSNMFAHSARATTRVMEGVKRALPRLPVFPKLSPNVTSLEEIAGAALEGGADGLSLINTVLGMAIDVDARRPRLAGVVGGLSGPAIHPIAVKAVHEVHRAFPGVAILGQGGITGATGALELILAGASAVAVGTGNFTNPRLAAEVSTGIVTYMEREGIGSVGELVGALKLEG